MKLSVLAAEMREKTLTEDAEIHGLCTDSRLAVRGDLFFAYKGETADSHFFAEEALKRGAGGVVCEHALPLDCPQLIVRDGREAMARLSAAFYAHPERSLRVIGITGTNGKTTTAHLLRHILLAAGCRAGIIGTLGVRFADRSYLPELTTPDPPFLFSVLRKMVQSGIEYVVMESSAHALALRKECPIVYDVGIFTNLTRDHLDFFRDMEAYGAAKCSMFSRERCRFGVLNADDAFSREITKQGGEYTTYGLETPADAFAVIGEENAAGTQALFNMNDELCDVHVPLCGRHNVLNALAAAVAARRLGISLGAISRGIGGAGSVEGRLEHVASFREAEIFVDFAHTPDGLQKALSTLRAYCTGRLLLVFGCGGNRDRGKRSSMGECAARLSDFCVITSDNPRFEDPCDIIAEIERGFVRHSKEYVAVEDREKAIRYALGKLRGHDILLVAGKGGETYQEIMGIKHDYNDKAVIRKLIGQMS